MIFVSDLDSVIHKISNFSIDWILSNALKRFPILGESDYEALISGADSFTPDGRLIMNESAEVRHWFNKKTYSNQINNRLD
jgi:glycine/D-amino acid oxidase-like deaminating enzyme